MNEMNMIINPGVLICNIYLEELQMGLNFADQF